MHFVSALRLMAHACGAGETTSVSAHALQVGVGGHRVGKAKGGERRAAPPLAIVAPPLCATS